MDPVSRLQLADKEIDRTFGDGYAAAHPDVICAVMNAASSDWDRVTIAASVREVAEALLVEEEASGIMQRRELLRVRP